MHTYTLHKNERICSKVLIEKMFSGGSKSFSMFPLRVVFMPMEKKEDVAAAILLSVAKKRFKRAVMRNRIKRQMREAYRKNKHLILTPLEQQPVGLAIAFIYLSNEQISSSEMEEKMKLALIRIGEKLQ